MVLRLKRTVNPTEEPVSPAEAKSHLRVDFTDDDALIEGLIQVAREHIEDRTGRALVTQTWKLELDDWPGGDVIALPRPPLVSVTSIVYTDSGSTANTFAATNYSADTVSEPGRVVLGYGKSWPSATLRPMSPIAVTYVAGYGAAESVPQWAKQAMLLLISHWYENREATVTGAGVLSSPIPFAVDSLLYLNEFRW